MHVNITSGIIEINTDCEAKFSTSSIISVIVSDDLFCFDSGSKLYRKFLTIYFDKYLKIDNVVLKFILCIHENVLKINEKKMN